MAFWIKNCQRLLDTNEKLPIFCLLSVFVVKCINSYYVEGVIYVRY